MAHFPTVGVAQFCIVGNTLESLVNSKADPDAVAELTTAMHQQIIANYDIQVVPPKKPDFVIAKQLYAKNCIACHGIKGASESLPR